MWNSLFEKTPEKKSGLKYQFIIIESLVFLLPLFVLFYIFHERNISLDSSHLILLAMIILLILSGLVILRHVFEGFSSFGELIKKAAEAGQTVSWDIRKDVAELEEISSSFMQYMEKFEKVTEDLSRKTSELKALKELAESVGKTLDIDALLNIILNKALELKRAKMGSVFIVDHAGRQLRLVGTRGIEALPANSLISIDRSLLRHVVTEGRSLLVRDIENDPRTLKKNDPRYGAPSFLSMPVFAGNELIAILTLANKESGEAFDASDEEILSIMLTETGFALENALLHSRVEEHLKEIEERNVTLEQEIAERKRAENKLINALRELEEAKDMVVQSEKFAAIGQLTAGVAHEILNPVNIIAMELQMLLGMKSISPEVHEELNVCMDQIDRIVVIAQNLKQLSRIPIKKTVMADINNVIAHVLALYATQFRIEEIKTEAHYQPDLPEIAMDKEKIEQVIINLITNAMAAMDWKEAKILRIKTERESLHQNKDEVKIMIADNGTGIKSEHMSKIFDPFFTTKGQGKGTGLGLSISYGIVHDHGGTIWAENNEWGGASFYVRMPVKTDIDNARKGD
jgi:two-component system cell cycle sensor histidine kinase/response regulator CckA